MISSLRKRLAKVKMASFNENAQIILDALGGVDKIKASTGKNILSRNNGNGVIIQTPVIWGKGVENVFIDLNEMGLFDLKFYNPIKGTTPKVKKIVQNVSSDQIVSVFEKQTGIIIR